MVNPEAREIATWVLVAVSILLAVSFPVIAHWRLSRPAALDEMWLYSRRGTVVTGCAVGVAAVVLFALPTVWLAIEYPFMFGVLAMMAGVMVALVMVLIRYVRYDRRQLGERLRTEDDD